MKVIGNMGAARELADKKVLRSLVPLNSLSQVHFKEVTKNAVVEKIPSGKYLFQQGMRDSYTFYVLSGEVSILNGQTVIGSIKGGSKQSRQPLPNEQPRKFSARAKTKITVMRIDSSLLDVLLDWDQSGQYEVSEIQSDDNEDWMSKMLRSELFAHVPAQNIQKMIMRMQEVRYKAGDSVIKQNDPGDSYYVVKSGQCVVSRQSANDDKPVLIAELRDGDSFGEEALLSDGFRNASVNMISDGVLMRLSKHDFQELLQDLLVTKVNWSEAQALVKEGAYWLDVRTPEEYVLGSIAGSKNIPHANIRSLKDKLDINDVYIVFCNNGHISASTVFILGQYGFDAVLLEDGLLSAPADALENQPSQELQNNQNTVSEVDVPVVEQVSNTKPEKKKARFFARDKRKKEAPPAKQEDDSEQFSKTVLTQARDQQSVEKLLIESKASKAEIDKLRSQLSDAKELIDEKNTELDQLSNAQKSLSQELTALKSQLGNGSEQDSEIDSLHKQLEEIQYEHELEKKKLEKEIALQIKQNEKAEAMRNEVRELKEEVKELERLQEQTEAELEQAKQQLQTGHVEQAESAKLQKKIQAESQKYLDLKNKYDELLAQGQEKQNEKEQLEKQLSEIKKLQQTEYEEACRQRDQALKEREDLHAELKLERQKLGQLVREKEQIENSRDEEEKVRLSLQEQQSNASQLAKQRQQVLEDEIKQLNLELKENRELIDKLTRAAKESIDKAELDSERKEFLETIENHQSKIRNLEDSNKELQELLKSSENQISKLKQQNAQIEFDWQAAEKARTGLIEEYEAEINKLNSANTRFEAQLNAEEKIVEDLRQRLKISNDDKDKRLEKLTNELKVLKKERDELKKEFNNLRSAQAKLDKSEAKLLAENAKLEKEIESRDLKIKETTSFLKALEQEKNVIEEAKLELQKEKKHAERETEEKLESLSTELRAYKHKNDQYQETISKLKVNIEQAEKRISEFELERDDLYEQLKVAEQRGIDQASGDKEVKSLMRELKSQEKDYKKEQNLLKTRILELEATLASQQDELKKYHNLQSVLEDRNQTLEGEVDRIDRLQNSIDEKDKKIVSLQRQLMQTQSELEANRENLAIDSASMVNESTFNKVKDELLALKDEMEILQARNIELEKKSEYADDLQNLLSKKAKDEESVQGIKSELALALSNNNETEQKLKSVQTELKNSQIKMRELSSELKEIRKQSGQASSLRSKVEGVKQEAKEKIKKYQSEYEAVIKSAQAENSKLRQELAQLQKQHSSMGSRQEFPTEAHGPLNIADIPDIPKVGEQQFAVPEMVGQSEYSAQDYSQFPTETFGERTQVNFVADEDALKSFSLARFVAIFLVILILGSVAYWFFDVYPRVKREAERIDANTQKIVPKITNQPINESKSSVKQVPKTASTSASQPVKAQSEHVTKPAKAIAVSAGRTFQDKLKHSGSAPLMVVIPAATFAMGSPDHVLEDNEKPRHTVQLKSYAISKYEVTFAEYNEFVQATGRELPEHIWGQESRPVINVSWNEAVAYTKWLSVTSGYVYRLPTEAEWEYAARAGTFTDYYWGGSIGKNNANCLDCGSRWDNAKTAPVGSFSANQFGLHDMLGNVMEWTLDCYHPNYKQAPSDGSAWQTASCKTRVLRGGSFKNTEDEIRSFAREHASAKTINPQIGFRVVREI